MPPDDLHKFIINNSFMDVTEVESYRALFPDLASFEAECGLPEDGQGILSIFPRLYDGACVK